SQSIFGIRRGTRAEDSQSESGKHHQTAPHDAGSGDFAERGNGQQGGHHRFSQESRGNEDRAEVSNSVSEQAVAAQRRRKREEGVQRKLTRGWRRSTPTGAQEEREQGDRRGPVSQRQERRRLHAGSDIGGGEEISRQGDSAQQGKRRSHREKA